MKISTIRKIVIEDYPAAMRDTMQRLAQTLNPFLDQVSAAISNQLTLRDNVKCKLYKVDLAADKYSAFVAWPLNEKPSSVTLAQLALANGNAPASAFSLHWQFGTQNGTQGIFLTFLGLAAATEHTVTILAQV